MEETKSNVGESSGDGGFRGEKGTIQLQRSRNGKKTDGDGDGTGRKYTLHNRGIKVFTSVDNIPDVKVNTVTFSKLF